MRASLLFAFSVAATLAVSGLAGCLGKSGPSHAHAEAAGADEHALHGGMAGDAPGHEHGGESHHSHDEQTGMDRPDFAPAEGSVPSADDASRLQQVSRIRIVGDKGFTPAGGVRGGNGTLENPFVISGYYVLGDLYIQDTDACFVVKENYIAGQLTLNWNGLCVHAHHNFIRDLRVNENIRRTGYATGGLLELNQIEVVGQLRHYDGEFRGNIVGPKTEDSLFDPVREEAPYLFSEDPRVANVDGFNQGLIHHNTFYGSVDLDFHGHHHGSGFFATHSHYHGDNESRKMAHDDHTDRYTSVSFTDNRIVDSQGYGLRYDDEQHAADDRTAASEQEDYLDEDHVHHTHVVIAANVLEGAPIWVDVFNADDDHHPERNPGSLEILDNVVNVQERSAQGPAGLPLFGPDYRATSGIRVWAGKQAEIRIAGNSLAWTPATSQGVGPLFKPAPVKAAAIDLDFVRDANVTIVGDKATGFAYGVRAHKMDERTHWLIQDCVFDKAQYEVYYDDTVENRPGA